MHVHVEADDHGHFSLDEELMDASAAYFKGSENRTPSVADLARYYRDAGMAAVIFTIDATTATGHPALSSEEIAQQASEFADVLIPFGSVDPHQGQAAVERAGRLVEEYGVRGFKFHPSLFSRRPGVPAALGGAAGPGGPGAVPHRSERHRRGPARRSRDQTALLQPLLLDDVAAEFPGLQVILAHPSVPWQAEAISMATHKSNVFIDLSGWRPKYFPPELVRAAKTMLRRQVLFGTDYPLITPQRWFADFDERDVDPAVRELIVKENAARLLGL